MSTWQANDYALTSTCILSFRKVLYVHECFIIIIVVLILEGKVSLEFQIIHDSFPDICCHNDFFYENIECSL